MRDITNVHELSEQPTYLLSVLYIFVTSLTDVSELFHIGSLDVGKFYYVYPAVKCRSVATVLRFSDDRLNI